MIKELTSLRFIFISFIVLHHLHIYDGGGSMAVAFFFVLSGFSLTLGYKEKVVSLGFSYGNYVKRRCVKFYPLHWLCLLASIPLIILNLKLDLVPKFFLNATLLHSFVPLKDWYFSFNWVSWYMSDAMFMAVTFPLILKGIVRSNRIVKTVIAVVTLILYAILAVLLPDENKHAILYINPIVRTVDFIVGIYLALAFLKLKDSSKICLFVWQNTSILVLASLVMIVLLVVLSCRLSEPQQLTAAFYWPLVMLLIVTVAFIGNWGGQNLLQHKYLVKLGELSFIIFLTHQLVIRYYALATRLIGFENKVVECIVCIPIIIIVSFLIQDYILKPITTWLTKKLLPSMTARS